MYSTDFMKRKKQRILLYPFTDFWFRMLNIPGVYIKDGAQRRLNFRHFRHFSSLQAFFGLTGFGLSE